MIGIQELIAIGIVAAAVILIVRRLTGGSGSGACSRCSSDAGPVRRVKVQQLHDLQVRTPQSTDAADAPPRNGD